MTPDGRARHLHGHGLLVLDPDQIEPVDYWLDVGTDYEGRVTTSGWIATQLPVLERLWRSQRVVTLVLNDGGTVQLQLTSEFGGCIVIEPST